jgi:type VII secretion-associated serine protease mycosin
VRKRVRALVLAAMLAVPQPPATAAASPPLPNASLNGQWWFAALQVGKIWASGAQGQGVTVAVLDSGVNAARPELAGRVLAGTDLVTGGDGRTDYDRSRAHGTAMALFIAGQGGPSGLVGIAPQAQILPVRLNQGPSTGGDQRLVDGIRWAVDNGAKVINASIGPSGVCPAEVQDAVSYAVGKGAVFVASAGNSGDSGSPPEYPASCAGVLAAGAVDAARHAWPATTRQSYVDVGAPGADMASINAAGQAGKSNGTSDAAALTSAAIALIWSKFPALTNRQVVARLLATLRDDADLPGPDPATGRGLIRPYNAITTPVPPNAANPVFDELDRLDPATGTPPNSAPTTPGAGSAAPAPPTASPGNGISETASGSGTLIAVGAALLAVGVAVALLIVLLVTRRRRTLPQPPPWPPTGGSPRWP